MSNRVALIVDNPLRDLPGMVLVALWLCQRGITCYLVPSNLQNEIWSLVPDFVLLNYLRTVNEDFAHQLAEAGIHFGVLDTEGGVFTNLDYIVEFAELGDYIDMLVKYYSSGMYARLGFSVAVHAEPDILLVDEVLSVGDIGFQSKSSERMKRFRDSGCTIVFVSHRMSAVATMCDQALWLDNGIVRKMGDVQQVIQSYLDFLDEQSIQCTSSVACDDGSDTSPIVVTKVQLLNAEGQHCSEFRYGDVLIVRLEYKASHPVHHPKFIVGISHKGHTLFGANMNLDGRAHG